MDGSGQILKKLSSSATITHRFVVHQTAVPVDIIFCDHSSFFLVGQTGQFHLKDEGSSSYINFAEILSTCLSYFTKFLYM